MSEALYVSCDIHIQNCVTIFCILQTEFRSKLDRIHRKIFSKINKTKEIMYFEFRQILLINIFVEKLHSVTCTLNVIQTRLVRKIIHFSRIPETFAIYHNDLDRILWSPRRLRDQDPPQVSCILGSFKSIHEYSSYPITCKNIT